MILLSPYKRSVIILSFAILLCLLNSNVYHCTSIWTRFDLVRKEAGHWGSKWNIPYIKIGRGINGGPPMIQNYSFFGCSIDNLGDLDGDGVADLVVGAFGEDEYTNTSMNLDAGVFGNGTQLQLRAGAVYILFMSPNGSVSSYSRISSMVNGGPALFTDDKFGSAVAAIGDVDGDGVMDIAVGAPGYVIGAVYICFMSKNGTVRDYTLIRGKYVSNGITGNSTSTTNSTTTISGYPYTVNGPSLTYGSLFGSYIGAIGDLNNDSYVDIAVAAPDAMHGASTVYILFLNKEGVVSNFTSLASGENGAPVTGYFTDWGSAIYKYRDIDNDGIIDLIITAKKEATLGTSHDHSGKTFICFMRPNGTIKAYEEISEYTSQGSTGTTIPNVAGDECGSSVMSIGDMNKDNYRQQAPLELSKESGRTEGFEDLVIGCPQSGVTDGVGRLFILFMNKNRKVIDYKYVPDVRYDENEAPNLKPSDRFGTGMLSYNDLDENGINEIIATAPGDDEGGHNTGAFYILFHRRRRHHSPPSCHYYEPCYYLFWQVPLYFLAGCAFLVLCILAYRYRRIPDETENIVKKSGLVITANRKRVRKQFADEAKVAASADDF